MEKHSSDVANAVKAAMPDTGATDPRSSDVEDVEIDSWTDDGGAPEPAGTQSEGSPRKQTPEEVIGYGWKACKQAV